jgi:hypothetical protein
MDITKIKEILSKLNGTITITNGQADVKLSIPLADLIAMLMPKT